MKTGTNKKFIILTGPTAVGKTEAVASLAARWPIEVINGDMGQLYTPLTIGTAKPLWRQEPVPHHLFDILDTPEHMTVVMYRELVLDTMEGIWARGALPVIVGGSGFYLRSLFFPPRADDIPEDNNIRLPEENIWEKLLSLDPERAEQLHPHDTYRIQRALALCRHGIKASRVKPLWQPPAQGIIVVLDRERKELYERINERVVTMVQDGLIEEVRRLLPDWHDFLLRKRLIGYDDTIRYLNDELTHDQLIGSVQQKTRYYAKRQISFFKNLLRLIQEHDDVISMWCSLTTEPLDVYIELLEQKLSSF